MYVEVKKKNGGKYEVTPDVTPTANVDGIDYEIPCFNSQNNIILAVDSNRKFVTSLSDVGNISMMLDVSSGGGNARACYRADNSSIWNDFGTASSSISYYDNCTFEMNGTTLEITIPGGIDTEYDNITVSTSPISYISVGNVGS